MASVKHSRGVLIVSALMIVGSIPTTAFAISADLAKKCRASTVRAYPHQQAGSRTGTAQAERGFFQNCVAQNGNVEPAPAPANPQR
jgi:hypothetical protein